MRLPRWFLKNHADAPLTTRMQDLEARQDRLEGMFATLQGYVYARRGKVGAMAASAAEETREPVHADGAPALTTKEILRRQLAQNGRIMPGKPTQM